MRDPMLTIMLLAAALLWPAWAPPAAGDDGPRQIEIADANYYLAKLESYADSLKGAKGPLTPDARIALRKVGALRAKYPNSSKVDALYRRARAAVRKLQGASIKVTAEVLAYRRRKQENAGLLAAESVKAWEDCS